jgi:hypothetical protein
MRIRCLLSLRNSFYAVKWNEILSPDILCPVPVESSASRIVKQTAQQRMNS